MTQTSLLVAAGIMSLFGWGWFKSIVHWFRPGPDQQRAKVEQRLKDEGTVRQDETVHVDAEFDAELTDINKELKDIDVSGDADLTAEEKAE